MSILDASYFKRGDIAAAHFRDSWRDTWVTGRVIGLTETESYQSERYSHELFEIELDRPGAPNRHEVRVAINQPYETLSTWMPRVYPRGMPVYQGFQATGLRLLGHDPNWNPFAVEPPASAPVNRERYIYLTGHHYRAGDPVWVWEDDRWIPATVMNINRWVSVAYLDGFRDRAGHRSKSYKTWQVWPVMSESSAILKKDLETRI